MKKKNLLLLSGVGVLAFLFVVFIVFTITKKNSPEKVIDEYCDILVKGNFEDALDLMYFPESEFITEEKIEELKDEYYKKMSEDFNNIVNCTYTETKETDEIIYYKIVMEKTDGNDT